MLKARVLESIDKQASEIKAIGRELWKNPELGYKEKKTGAIMVDVFKRMGMDYRTGIAISGIKGFLSGRSQKGTIAVAGDMDAILVPNHPEADIETGAAHACGHHAQVTAVLACAMALASSGVMSELDGDVQFLGMNAEEYVELDFRRRLVEKGLISFIGGKASWIALGELDGLDLYLASHTGELGGKVISPQRGGTNGFVGKMVQFKGKEAHAGGAPHLGVNALNAAVVSLVALNAQRETFQDFESIRIHPIITKGGDLVNVVPADIRMETYVRGKTFPGILDAAAKFDRAMKGGAMSVGAEVVVDTLPGYLPQRADLAVPVVVDLLESNALSILGESRVRLSSGNDFTTASSDFGDVSHVIPAARISTGGVTGAGHSPNFRVVDEDDAYVAPARVLASTIVDLLSDGAKSLAQSKREYSQVYSSEGYVKMWNDLMARDR
jgi:amidohydrolase